MEEQTNLLFQKIFKKRSIKFILCDIKTTGILLKKDHLFKLTAIEINNFKLTGNLFHMYIKPRVYISNKYSKLNHIKYNDYFNFNQDTKTQLENLLNFIGKTLVLFIDDISYEFLSDEMKYWGLYDRFYKNTFTSSFLNLIKESNNRFKIIDFVKEIGFVEKINDDLCRKLKFEEKIHEFEDLFYEILKIKNEENNLSIYMSLKLFTDFYKYELFYEYNTDSEFRENFELIENDKTESKI